MKRLAESKIFNNYLECNKTIIIKTPWLIKLFIIKDALVYCFIIFQKKNVIPGGIE